jgi:hypothetical protein
MTKRKGWRNEPVRHSLASKGVKTGRKKRIAKPRSVSKVVVTLSKREAEKLRDDMAKKGHAVGIDRGFLGYRVWIPTTRKAVADYNKLTGRELKYSKKGVWL